MKKTFTKTIVQNLFARSANRFIALLIGIACFTFIAGKAQGQIVNIPDPNFLSSLINQGFDTDNDGQISYVEAAAVSYIDVTGAGISDLTGIEAFINITDLYCGSNSLSSLDMSANTQLANFDCDGNSITSLNVSSNTALSYFVCSFNQIASLNVSNCSGLGFMDCSFNSLTSLNISANTSLGFLDCSGNSINSLDVHLNTALTQLFCNSNSLSNIDIHLNTNLQRFGCSNNLLTSIDVSKNTALAFLFVDHNQLTSLDAHLNPNLLIFHCQNNVLTSLNIQNGNNTAISGTSNSFDALNNPNLTCIQVDNVAFSQGSWVDVDPTASFSTNCSPCNTPPSCTITGSSNVLGAVANVYSAPANMDSYSWSVSGNSAAITGSSTSSQVSITSSCHSGSYTVSVTVSKNGCSSTCNMNVNVSASATLTVYSSLYTTGSGNHPSVTKTALLTNLKVFRKHNCGNPDNDQGHYANIWNSTNGLVTNASVSSPVLVTYGGGPAYKYVITVPPADTYTIIGQSMVSSNKCNGGTCTIYTGNKVGDHDEDDDIDACSNTKIRLNTILKDKDGKCKEGVNQVEHGSLLWIVSPATLEFTDSTDNLPIVYESVEGDWDVSVLPTPPYGFYADPDNSLSTSVQDNVINAVQYTIVDTGSVWTNTVLTHTIQHKGSQRIAYSHPAMVNNRTNKLVGINIQPNPANDNVRIQLTNFEGTATVMVYDIFGQKVIEQPISIFDGASASLDISTLPMGVYLISAQNSTGRVSTKLIKEN